MSTPTRRTVLLSTASAGAVALGGKIVQGQEGIRSEQGLQRDEKDWPSPVELLNQLQTSEEALRRAELLPPLDLIPVSLPAQQESKANKVDAKVVGLYDGSESLLMLALSWTCPSDQISLFTVGGQPFRARRFAFSVRNISWKAGSGWPVYTTYCPRNDYGDMYYRHAKVHQIVPSIRGQNYFVGCYSSAIAQSNAAGQVAFAVNDGPSHYSDNRGTFQVVITDWS